MDQHVRPSLDAAQSEKTRRRFLRLYTYVYGIYQVLFIPPNIEKNLGRWPASPLARMIARPTRYRPSLAGFRFPKGHTPLQHFYRVTRSASPFFALQRSWLFHVNIHVPG